MKKIAILMTTLMTLSFLGAASFASDVGYVDYSVMYKNITASKEVQRAIDAKQQEINKYNETTLTLAKKQETVDLRNQAISQRGAGLQKLEQELSALKHKQNVIVKSKVKAAAETVMIRKRLDIIIDKRYQVAGGVDCTQEILGEIQ